MDKAFAPKLKYRLEKDGLDDALSVDQYGHIIRRKTDENITTATHTDPYGGLEYVVGSADDFVCFDFLISVGGGPAGKGVLTILHSVLNSETGHFCQDFAYDYDYQPVLLFTEFPTDLFVGQVDQALDWCEGNDVHHDRQGWNQDPDYVVRRAAQRWAVLVDGQFRNPRWDSVTDRSIRFGGRKVNYLAGLSDEWPKCWARKSS